MRKIIYAATPFRMEDKKDKICDFIQEEGHFPLHPFNTLPMSRYNYNNFTREEIMRVCYGMVDLSDELWIFGIGGGSLDEATHAKQTKKPVVSFIRQFDPLWQNLYIKNKYQEKYSELLQELLNQTPT